MLILLLHISLIMGWFRIFTWSVRHCLARPSAWQWAKILELMQLLFFERLALSVIYLLIEGNSESLSLLVSWKGSTWGESISIVHLLESFRMSFARKRVWIHCWLDRMMFVSAALITSWLRRGLWSFYQAVMSEMSKWKVGRLFLNLSLLWYFGRTRRFT